MAPSTDDLAALSPSEKDALIRALLARVEALRVEVEALRTENATLQDKLNLPPKTPRNSSKPRDCPEFRVWAGMMGGKEPPHAEAQRASYSGRHP